MDLLHDKIKTLYLKYLAAAFGSALISCVYGVEDMAMVSNVIYSPALPNLYIRIFMSPTAEIPEIATAGIRASSP